MGITDTKTERITGFDFARALAILGMMLVNYRLVFTMERVTWPGPAGAIALLEGRAAAVFLLLAGIGISLMSGGTRPLDLVQEQRKLRTTLVRRALFLFVLGMVLYTAFEWTADILHYYGVFMVVLATVLFAQRRSIILLILGLLAVSTVMQLLLDYTAGWTADFMAYHDFFTLRGFLRHTLFNGYHPLFPWIAFMLIGILLGRTDFNDLATVRQRLLLSAGAALLIEAVSRILIHLAGGTETAIYLFNTKPMNPTAFYVAAAAAWGTAFIYLCRLLQEWVKRRRINRLYQSIVQTGQMALTHYVLHSVVVLGVFYTVDELAYRDEWFVVLLSAGVFLGMVLFSVLWLKKFRRGPLELVMRRIAG